MSKCFITRLYGVVPNAELKKLGELKVVFIKEKNYTNYPAIYLTVKESGSIPVRVVGNDALIYDISNSQSYGKEATFVADLNSRVRFCIHASDNFTLFIGNKYNINSLGAISDLNSEVPFVSDNSNEWSFAEVSHVGFIDVEEVKVLPLQKINMGSCVFNGDISDIKVDNLSYCVINKDSDISTLYGDASNLMKQALQVLYLQGKNVLGNIGMLNTSLLTNLNIKASKINGDISLLSFPVLKKLTLYSSCTGNLDNAFTSNTVIQDIRIGKTNITFDVGKLPDSAIFVSQRENNNTNASSALSYTKKASRTKVITCEDLNFKNSVASDNFLKHMAELSETDKGNGRYIILSSKRTSASDSAIATLQKNNYTVVTPPVG